MRKRVSYAETPQVTALEYHEMRDLEEHPEKQGEYAALVKKRTKLGADFQTKPPTKKKRRSA